MFESKSESLVGSAERTGSVTIINTLSSIKPRATREYRKTFTNLVK